jgi:hypothetical protein
MLFNSYKTRMNSSQLSINKRRLKLWVLRTKILLYSRPIKQRLRIAMKRPWSRKMTRLTLWKHSWARKSENYQNKWTRYITRKAASYRTWKKSCSNTINSLRHRKVKMHKLFKRRTNKLEIYSSKYRSLTMTLSN